MYEHVLDSRQSVRGTGQEPLLILHEGNALKSVHCQQTLIALEYTHTHTDQTHKDDEHRHTGVYTQTGEMYAETQTYRPK